MSEDISLTKCVSLCERQPFAVTSNSQIYNFRDGSKVFKLYGSQREYDMLLAAEGCSVRPFGRVLRENTNGPPSVLGFTMPRKTPLDVRLIDPSQQRILIDEMISCVLNLHRKGIVHGDIKPANMLLCSNGKLCLCDFAEARPINEDPEEWDGMATVNYTSPHRCQVWPDQRDPAPTIQDDLYGLGLSIWELCTGIVPFNEDYVDDVRRMIKAGQTVDLHELVDEEVRDIVSGYLRQGGATI